MYRKAVVKKIISLIFILLWVPLLALAAPKKIQIAVLADGPNWENELILKALKNELSILTGAEFEIKFPANLNMSGDYNLKQIKASAKQLANHSQADLIIALGHQSALTLAKLEPLKKPVLAIGILFPGEFGVLAAGNLRPLNPNWTTTYDPSIGSSITFTAKKLLNLKKVAVICTTFLCGSASEEAVIRTEGIGKLTIKSPGAQVRALPNRTSPVLKDVSDGLTLPILELTEQWVRVPQGWIQKKMVNLQLQQGVTKVRIAKNIPEIISSQAAHGDLEVEFFHLSPEKQDYSRQLEKLEADLAFVLDLASLSEQQETKVYDLLKQNKVPSLTFDGSHGIRMGAMLSLNEQDYQSMGRGFALKIISILSGIKPNELSIVDEWKINLTFNIDTARAIDFDIPVELLYEAEWYTAGNQELYTLEEAVTRALKYNYSYQATQFALTGAEQQTRVVESGYRPQIASSLSYSQTNKTRADVASSPRQETKVEVTLSQNLWDPELDVKVNQAELGVSVAENQQILEQVNLEEAVTLAYLNVLQSFEVIRARKQHLQSFRKLREIAQLRYNLQETSKSDVLRVSIDYKNALIQMTTAIEVLNQAKVNFNSLLQFPKAREAFLDPGLFTEKAFQENKNILEQYKTVKQIEALQIFLTQKTWENAPELTLSEQQLEQLLLEQQRIESQFSPKFQAGASVFRQLNSTHRDFTAAQEEAYDDIYQAGWGMKLTLSVPLYSGGSRYRQLDKIKSQIREQTAYKEQLKSDLARKSRLVQFKHFSNQGRLQTFLQMIDDAHENLSLGEESYIQGTIPIMDLLDLQGSVILTEINAINSRYQYHESLVQLLRTIGKLHFLIEGDDSPESLEFRQELREQVMLHDEE
ncbi:MAG: hypothetical protein COB67_04445 [SAR324 cluster bacterium]|uniref:TolC family protein n=1 Tax=SAR324 cluster bacterium TaxID=2024889 RepID=A0A2A4T6S4_9DELT|nr:MAG: hypothetical protein COB67_04445 [SAR324 cluster bacterium]